MIFIISLIIGFLFCYFTHPKQKIIRILPNEDVINKYTFIDDENKYYKYKISVIDK